MANVVRASLLMRKICLILDAAYRKMGCGKCGRMRVNKEELDMVSDCSYNEATNPRGLI